MTDTVNGPFSRNDRRPANARRSHRPTAVNAAKIVEQCRHIERARQSILTPGGMLAKCPRTNRHE